MDDLLANLGATDGSVFDAQNVLGASFDLESGFMSSPQTTNLYPSDVPAHMRPQNSEMDFLTEEEEKPVVNITPTATPPVAVKRENSQIQTAFAEPTGQQSESPESQNPIDVDRRRLRPIADNVVLESWRLVRSQRDFIAAVRRRLPRSTGTTALEESSDQPGLPVLSSITKSEPMSLDKDGQEDLWGLPLASEGALLDALMIRLVNAEAPSMLLMKYLSYSLLSGLVSQNAVIATYLTWTTSTENVSVRVMRRFAEFLVDIIPNYSFSNCGGDLFLEVKQLLNAFISVIRSTARSPEIAPALVQMLSHDRTIALVRSCLRRIPSMWDPLRAALAQLESAPPVEPGVPLNFAPQSAFAEASELRELVEKLQRGLCVGITSLEKILSSLSYLMLPKSDAPLPAALNTPYAVTVQVFGNEVAGAIRELWSQKESQGGDVQHLYALVRATKPPTPNHPQPDLPKYGLTRKVKACEAAVRFLSQKASSPGATDLWRGIWGGTQRLQRIIRDGVPQVKNEITTETSALIVAMAVICVAALCLGPSLRVNDGNDGIETTDPEVVKREQEQNQHVEESIGELTAFAVNSLEAAATADETPVWRSFGVWLLLLMSRCGTMLRASGCDHVRAVKVLRAWGGMPIGTQGPHVSHGTSAHKHSQSGTGHQQSQSSSSLAQSEGLALFASSSALAIIDASDVSGSEETLRALCDDVVQ
ncbi:unnamed protein product [Agarophyton chilense]|eukprot:gb/GEZJ01000372.1/.p1 GENE.gb/GEZJ01000372.1/~~gb/GEZJ01000372.1/.p1  ORF type:complete len:706 (-),score=75.23 gb/GEZJ01000372.1/:1307-3424(-)